MIHRALPAYVTRKPSSRYDRDRLASDVQPPHWLRNLERDLQLAIDRIRQPSHQRCVIAIVPTVSSN